MSLTDNVLDAVEILVDNKISGLQFNKTIRGKISEVVDASIGKYKIQYQNSYFTAYSTDSSATYQKGSEVYVEILSNDFEKNAVILGTVRRLGSNYITIVEELDKYAPIGAELKLTQDLAFCSYSGEQTSPIDLSSLDITEVEEAAPASDALKVAMRIKTALDTAQRAGGGNYGLEIVARYYDAAYIDKSVQITRTYLFDINEMLGQPYKYTAGSNQYAIFSIDPENFISIDSITAFCKDFPLTADNKPDDIFISDISLQFLKAYTEEQLNSTSLTITTPKGSYFSVNSTGDKILHADLRVKGKKVNYDAQQIDFYWFKRNTAITAESEKFSAYGGNSWECLNKISAGLIMPAGPDYTLRIGQCTARDTKFKCVAVFLDNGQSVSISDTIIFRNRTNDTILSISSSSGTLFSFNIGSTTLTLNGYDNAIEYIWTESIDGGAAVPVGTNSKTLEVEIATPAANLLTYDCSVFNDSGLVGTASITLINSYESLGYTLVIKDSQQIFKYDSYGVSPAAQSKAAADRMTIPMLSFDIYDKQGNVIDIKDDQKAKHMIMRWIWPTNVDSGWTDSQEKKKTMLTTSESMSLITTRDIANNRSIQKYALVNKPTFSYGIIDRYNAVYANTDSSRNNVRLEVEYQGEFLTAETNFSFTKEGELGTNGTKLIARIEAVAGFEEIFIARGTNNQDQLMGLKKTTNGFEFVQLGASRLINSILSAQLWDGNQNVASTASSIIWEISKSTSRQSVKSRLTIQNNNVIINNNGTSYSNIIQVIITYNGIKYYATYPFRYITQPVNNRYLWVTDGYREVMYESDGTRGKFNPLPFVPKWLAPAGFVDITNATINAWATNSNWGAVAKKVSGSADQFTIEPPNYYIGEYVGNYVKFTYGGATTYLPIEFYLNRYGMSAMNDWDGAGIQVNNDGGYILAPQVGAGRKELDNSFTGITIGEVFQNVNNKEIGMFGYYKGQRSLFLDAETGDAEFGIASEGQIKIRASDGQGTISDGHYKFDHTGGTGRGMKIKFTSTAKDPKDPNDEQGPYIKYGTGNFMVNSQGYITAQGGGSVAGWKITDISLSSQDDKTNLYSSGDIRFNINNKFYIYSDGRFSAANNKFSVTAEGVITATSGTIGGFTIEDHRLYANTEKLVLNDNGSIYGPGANYNFTPNKRVWEITPNGYAYFTDVKIRNNNAAEHGGDYDNNYFTWVGKETVNGVTTYPNIFTLTDTGSKIGGWTITGNEFNSGGVHINSAAAGTGNSVLSVNDAFQIYGNGSFSASGGGQLGGCSVGAGGGGGILMGNSGLMDGVLRLSGENLRLEALSVPSTYKITGNATLDHYSNYNVTVVTGVSASGYDRYGGITGLNVSTETLSIPMYRTNIDISGLQVKTDTYVWCKSALSRIEQRSF